jgi:hypothetical protein
MRLWADMGLWTDCEWRMANGEWADHAVARHSAGFTHSPLAICHLLL